jgi:hypothetical protein
LNISFEALEQLAKIMMKESVNEAVVASMRTSSGQRDLEKKGGKLTMKMPNGEVLKFKDGADVKEYMDRVYGYWSFIKGYGKVKGLRESTAAYEKALQKIVKDKQLSMLSKKDRETLLKVAKLMKSANEGEKIDEKAEFGGFDSQTLGQLKQRMKKASANYGNWHINANEFLWDVDTSTGDGKKLKQMIYDNRFSGRNSGKKIQDLMEDIYKQAVKAKRD